ncbi:MAG: phosphatase PAP2 family protein [Bacteroidota bacterium]|nr:phosphatase PAP2 family protein [Bacteroidota bacterium]
MSLFEYDQHLLELINHNRIRSLDYFFILITNTTYLVALLVPGFILLYSYLKKDLSLKIKAWQIVASLAFNSIIITILKYTINRQRPFVIDKYIEKLSTGGSPSFPSGHTSDAFLIATCMTILFNKNKWLLFLIWIWAFVVAYTRLALGVHYPSDVIGAIIIGMSNAIIVNRIFTKKITTKTNNG